MSKIQMLPFLKRSGGVMGKTNLRKIRGHLIFIEVRLTTFWYSKDDVIADCKINHILLHC